MASRKVQIHPDDQEKKTGGPMTYTDKSLQNTEGKPANMPCREVQLWILTLITILWTFGFGTYIGTFFFYLQYATCMARNISSCSPGGIVNPFNQTAEEKLANADATVDMSLFYLCVGVGNFLTVNLLGELTDVMGRKIPMFIASVGGVLTQVLLLAWPGGSPLGIFFMVLLVLCNCTGGQWAVYSAAFSGINDLTEGFPAQERTKWQSIVLGGLMGGGALGTLLGGLVMEAAGDFIILPIIIGIVFMTLSMVPMALMPEPQAKHHRRKCTATGGNPCGGIILLLGPKGTRNTRILFFGYFFLYFGTIGTLVVAPVVFILVLGWSPLVASIWQTILWGIQGAANMGILPTMLMAKTKTGKQLFTRKNLILMSAIMAIVYSISNQVLFIPGIDTRGVGVTVYFFINTGLLCSTRGFFDPPTKAIIADEMPPEVTGLAMSGLASMSVIAQAAAAFVFPTLYITAITAWGMEYGFVVFLLATILNSIGFGIFLLAEEKKPDVAPVKSIQVAGSEK